MQERAILVHIDGLQNRDHAALKELQALAVAAGATVVQTIVGRYAMPHVRYFVGVGKAEEIASAVQQMHASLVLLNHELSAAQARNLERLCRCRVIDRTQLILDIFAQRARSYEGKLQVELAQLNYLSTRLIRGWTHLERQKGGIGLRGPGETQLETDRRLIKRRVGQLFARLEKIRSQRQQGRRMRARAGRPTVALVGYTNSGKSTLFNQLTRANTYTADHLFATLDPMLRRIRLAALGTVILADTVGFIHDLPHTLIAAFKTTLQETDEATLLLHVVDAADEERDLKIGAVKEVLREIGADQVPQLVVFNKVDLIPHESPKVERSGQQLPWRVWLSATQREGLQLLQQALSDLLSFYAHVVQYQLVLPPPAYGIRYQLQQLDALFVEERMAEDGTLSLSVRLPAAVWSRLNKQIPQLKMFIIG